MAATRLNVQGLARTDEGLMSCIVADPGHTIVSVDLSAGEPTCTAHYSGDKNYYDATFGMVGVRPYFEESGLLKIDDIYLTGASFSPTGAKAVREAFTATYNGVLGTELWTTDSDTIKKELSEVRKLHKILVLGIGYAMGPRKMVMSAYNKGYVITLKEAREFYNNYWETFADVKAFSDRLERLFKRKGYLVNDFGYRLKPDQSYKALNYWIQSSVSGIVNMLSYKFFTIAPYAQFLTIIHDEILFQVPDELLEDARLSMNNAVSSLNEDLNWSTSIRVGWAPGKDWYSAH